jgi:hypothetical protein
VAKNRGVGSNKKIRKITTSSLGYNCDCRIVSDVCLELNNFISHVGMLQQERFLLRLEEKRKPVHYFPGKINSKNYSHQQTSPTGGLLSEMICISS